MQFYLLEIGGIELLYAVLISIVAIIIVAFIVRWIFRINEIVDNTAAATWLLIYLCRKNGVDEKQIEEIKRVFKIK